MKLSKTRTMKFRMGEYEHLELTATAELDTDEFGPSEDPAALVNVALDELLQDDIDRADESSRTPEEDTYLHAWKDASN